MDFLDPDNIAGQSLLQLVARGSSIITELMRLSDHIPPVFLDQFDPTQDVAKYKAILPDFHYLKAAEKYDNIIDNNPDIVDLDEEFRENNMELLERFYLLFESLYKYIENYNSWLNDMNSGNFLQMTVDGVLLDKDGRQLMCEALYLYGVMLLLLDMRVPGKARERMVMAYYRYKGAAHLQHLDDVVLLVRDTGFSVSSKRPANYPEEYFSRVPVDASVIDMILGRLRNDDIYSHTSSFPLPAHRSTALASQASMLYVCLYFAPQVLSSSIPICREIVDRFYVDNWVVTIYMGYLVDLTDAWEPYKAAKNALKSAVSFDVIKECTSKHKVALASCCKQLDEYLTEGVLIDDYVMDNHRKLLDHVRACNVTLRWSILHRSSGTTKVRDMIRSEIVLEDILRLILNTSQFEFIVRSTIRKLLDTKAARWESYKSLASELTMELSEVFSGAKSLSRVKKSDKLTKWFKSISEEILSISLSNNVVAGRTLSELLKVLDAVGEYHQVESVLQVKQYLGEVRNLLQNMVRLANITPKILGDLDVITDFSYAKIQIKAFTQLIHEKISKDPSLCLLLRATFLKLSSLLSFPLVRVIQAKSDDDVSVAHYYSAELVAYVRTVLEIVPVSVFRLLDGITDLRLSKLKELLPKIERTHIKDYAQEDERYALSRHTNSISVFTAGILNMQTTLLGIVKLDPQQALEDGLRKQVVRQVSSAMNSSLDFTTGKLKDLESRLANLGRQLAGFQQSLEYVQDYVNIYGLKVWQEEVSRVINYNVEQESNQFLKLKVYDWQSKYQSDAIPIPIYNRSKDSFHSQFVNFTGRVVGELLRQVSVSSTIYASSRQGWFSIVDGTEVVGLRIFSLLGLSLGMCGLSGLDRLVAFMIVRDIGNFIKHYRKTFTTRELTQFLHAVQNELTPTSQFPPTGVRVYEEALKKTEKLWTGFIPLICSIGQQQLVRRHFNCELNFNAKLDSKILHGAVSTVNKALLADLRAHYDDPEQHKYPENPLLPEVSSYLDAMGVSDPVSKIYVTTEPLPGLPLVLFLCTLAAIQKLKWSATYSALVGTEKKPSLDGAPLILGLITILKQAHSAHTHTYLTYLGQYVRSHVSASADVKQKKHDLPELAVRVLMFLDEFCRFSGLSRKTIDAIVPSYLFDCYNRV